MIRAMVKEEFKNTKGVTRILKLSKLSYRIIVNDKKINSRQKN